MHCRATRELFHICYWLARTYGRPRALQPGLAFPSALLPKARCDRAATDAGPAAEA